MSLSINKVEMDQAWHDRGKSDKFYQYIYDIARHQVSKKGIDFNERQDYIQFAVYKCFKHEKAFIPGKAAAYSFFWKQISLAIAYKQRKEARRNSKIKTFYVDQEKVLDWIERGHEEEGILFSDIVELDEVLKIKKAFKKYNSAHKGNLKPNKENAIKILKWHEKNSPGFIEQFPTLKNVFKNWLKKETHYKITHKVDGQ